MMHCTYRLLSYFSFFFKLQKKNEIHDFAQILPREEIVITLIIILYCTIDQYDD